MAFDIDPWGQYLCTGTQDGRILFFDTLTFQQVCEVPFSRHPDLATGKGDGRSSSNCVNSVLFHPYYSLLTAISGERQFESFDSDDEDGHESAMTTAAEDTRMIEGNITFIINKLSAFHSTSIISEQIKKIIARLMISKFGPYQKIKYCMIL